MYTLILIVSFIANGASVSITHIPFNNKSACQEALIEVLRSYERTPTRTPSDLHVDGWCVAKG